MKDDLDEEREHMEKYQAALEEYVELAKKAHETNVQADA